MKPLFSLTGFILKLILLFIIRLYKLLISPLLGRNCIYYPTCSDYMNECLHKHGFWRGAFQGGSRILRCSSLFFRGGVDPVPEDVKCSSIKGQWANYKKQKS